MLEIRSIDSLIIPEELQMLKGLAFGASPTSYADAAQATSRLGFCGWSPTSQYHGLALAVVGRHLKNLQNTVLWEMVRSCP